MTCELTFSAREKFFVHALHSLNDFLTLKKVFERLAHVADSFSPCFRPFGPIFLMVTWLFCRSNFDRCCKNMQPSEIDTTMFLRA